MKELLLMVRVEGQDKSIVRPIDHCLFVNSADEVMECLQRWKLNRPEWLDKSPIGDICIFPLNHVKSIQVIYSVFEPRDS